MYISTLRILRYPDSLATMFTWQAPLNTPNLVRFMLPSPSLKGGGCLHESISYNYRFNLVFLLKFLKDEDNLS